MHIKKAVVLMVVELLVACGMGAIILNSFQSQQVQAFGIVPYGGRELFVVPPIIPPAPAICPKHTVIRSTDGISIFGVYVPPGGDAFLYNYKNLFTPGTPILGDYVQIPFPTCNLPYPVYPIYYNFPFYLTGTGGF